MSVPESLASFRKRAWLSRKRAEAEAISPADVREMERLKRLEVHRELVNAINHGLSNGGYGPLERAQNKPVDK